MLVQCIGPCKNYVTYVSLFHFEYDRTHSLLFQAILFLFFLQLFWTTKRAPATANDDDDIDPTVSGIDKN